jgi:DnaJ-class molecular chaperone
VTTDGVHDPDGDEAPDSPPQSAGERCPECDGTGERDGRECPACEGTGNVMRGLGGG